MLRSTPKNDDPLIPNDAVRFGHARPNSVATLDVPADKLAALVLRRFRVIFNAVKAHFRAMERDTGLGGAQLWALGVIRDQPGVGVGAVAQAMDIQASTASNLIRSLSAKALVTLARTGADRRHVQLTLTEAGQTVLTRVTGPLEGVLPDVLARLDATTLERLLTDLNHITQLIEGDDQAAQTPLADL